MQRLVFPIDETDLGSSVGSVRFPDWPPIAATASVYVMINVGLAAGAA